MRRALLLRPCFTRAPASRNRYPGFTAASAATETRIGSGSDYAALLDHAGVPVIDVGFGGPYRVYHSAYDDFYRMDHFGVPGFRYHAVIAQILGLLAVRSSNADFVPYDFSSFGAHPRVPERPRAE